LNLSFCPDRPSVSVCSCIGSLFFAVWKADIVEIWQIAFQSFHLKKWFYLLCAIQIVIAVNSIGHMSTLYHFQYSVFGIPAAKFLLKNIFLGSVEADSFYRIFFIPIP